MPIQVFGGIQQSGGINKALKEHRDHNRKQGDELLQLADGLDYSEDRTPYEQRVVGSERMYPKMLFKPDPGEKGEKIVLNTTEEAVAKQDGWREEPYPRVSVQVLDPATEKANLIDTNNRLQSQLIQQAESIQAMQEQMKELLALSKKGK